MKDKVMQENTPEPMPSVTERRLPEGAKCYDLGHFYLGDGSDSAYLYDPDGEEPHEVSQRGDYSLSLSARQARALRDRLNSMNL